MTNFLQKAWDYLKQANHYWDVKTQPIQYDSDSDKLAALQKYLELDADEQQKLAELHQQGDGDDFIDRKITRVNRYASHRTAFLLNAIAQFLLVNLSSVMLLSFVPASWFKVLLVGANLFFALLAWWRLRMHKSQLLDGPDAEPDWSIWGMFSGNRKRYNKHIKKQAKSYKVRMSDERLFMIMYLVNAVTIFIGSQLILSGYLPSLLQGIINIPLFIITIPLVIANGYWAFSANSHVVKAATERGSELDKLKL